MAPWKNEVLVHSFLITGQTLEIPIHVYGPETHMTAVVAYALKHKSSPAPEKPTFATANFLLPGGIVSQSGKNGFSAGSVDSNR